MFRVLVSFVSFFCISLAYSYERDIPALALFGNHPLDYNAKAVVDTDRCYVNASFEPQTPKDALQSIKPVRCAALVFLIKGELFYGEVESLWGYFYENRTPCLEGFYDLIKNMGGELVGWLNLERSIDPKNLQFKFSVKEIGPISASFKVKGLKREPIFNVEQGCQVKLPSCFEILLKHRQDSLTFASLDRAITALTGQEVTAPELQNLRSKLNAWMLRSVQLMLPIQRNKKAPVAESSQVPNDLQGQVKELKDGFMTMSQWFESSIAQSETNSADKFTSNAEMGSRLRALSEKTAFVGPFIDSLLKPGCHLTCFCPAIDCQPASLSYRYRSVVSEFDCSENIPSFAETLDFMQLQLQTRQLFFTLLKLKYQQGPGDGGDVKITDLLTDTPHTSGDEQLLTEVAGAFESSSLDLGAYLKTSVDYNLSQLTELTKVRGYLSEVQEKIDALRAEMAPYKNKEFLDVVGTEN